MARSLRPGQQPYDPANGMRIGAFAGGLVGVGVAVVTGAGLVWLLPLGGVVGGVIGYWTQRQQLGR